MENNKLFNDILESRKGHYCHVIETESAYSFECIIESIIQESGDKYSLEDYIQFFQTIDLYYLPFDGEEENKEDETELYNLNIKDTVTEIYEGIL